MRSLRGYGILLVVLLFIGCATTHEKFIYGGYTESHEQKMTLFHQFELSYTVTDKKGNKLVKSIPFMMNKQFTLPETTVDLGVGVYVKNLKKNYYEIWEEYEVLYKNTNEPYQIKRRLSKSELPDMILRIKLPMQDGAEYKYRVKIVDVVGSTLFSMGYAKYQILGK